MIILLLLYSEMEGVSYSKSDVMIIDFVLISITREREREAEMFYQN